MRVYILILHRELTEYTVMHFGYEEQLLEQFNYKILENHKAEHKILIEEIERLDLRAVDEDQVT